MAIIPVVATNTVPVPQAWELPESPDAIRSPIPRGLITFSGTDAVAALDAANQTDYQLTLTMPIGFAYLLKRCFTLFDSDDLVNDFDAIGEGFYTRPSIGSVDDGAIGNTRFALVSQGVANVAAAVARQIWAPIVATPKLLLGGADTCGVFLADMSADASSAGDMMYQWEFYVFDVDQIDKWEVNTPIPTISHTAF